jgi:hypothetical protein
MGGRITLSRLEYDVLWEHLELGPFQPVLAVPSPGRTHDERAELRVKAWASLAARDLGRPHDLDERLAHRLTRLARPEWEIDARLQLSEHGPRTTALAAVAGRGATVAVLDDELGLWSVRPDQVVAEMAGLLPTHPAGSGGSITLPAATVDHAAARAGSDRERFWRILTAKGLARAEATKVTGVLAEVVRMGHFGAARTTADRTRHRASHVVSVYDTPTNRFLFTRKNGWITLLPGTDAALRRQLDELLGELGRV